MRSKLLLFSHTCSILLVSLGVIGTTSMMVGSSIGQAWADVFEGTEGRDRIVGTPEDDIIDSKGGRDSNYGDSIRDDGSGDDIIVSGEGSDFNFGDTFSDVGSGNDNIISGEGNDENIGNGGDDNIIGGDGDDTLTGGPGADIFICDEGEDTVTDFNEEEGDIVTGDCENF